MSQVRVYIRDQFDLLIPLIPTALPPLYYMSIEGLVDDAMVIAKSIFQWWMIMSLVTGNWQRERAVRCFLTFSKKLKVVVLFTADESH